MGPWPNFICKFSRPISIPLMTCIIWLKKETMHTLRTMNKQTAALEYLIMYYAAVCFVHCSQWSYEVISPVCLWDNSKVLNRFRWSTDGDVESAGKIWLILGEIDRSKGPPRGAMQRCEEKWAFSQLFVRWGHSLAEYLELSGRFYQAFLNANNSIK